ncbi:MAG: homocysteine S-methyltransferase family protein [Pseudomonadota bacterium]
MPRYREALPQLGKEIFLTDGGMETDLLFNQGFDLPCFAAFDLLKSPEGRTALRRYYERHMAIARRHDRGFILEGVTWRASPDWGDKLGYDKHALAAANRDAITMMGDVRDVFKSTKPVVLSGCIGPRGDGYDPGAIMSKEEAEAYHSFQADIFAMTDADMITAMTITNSPEAIGVARAGAAARMPVVVSFTVETDGRLPTGQPLGEAIMEVDFESTTPPAYYMVNCAHPTHFAHVLEEGGPWLSRLKGVRANASTCSHTELDEAETLDDGDPVALGFESIALRQLAPGITVLGGCCGTDHRHIEEIAKAADGKQHAA